MVVARGWAQRGVRREVGAGAGEDGVEKNERSTWPGAPCEGQRGCAVCGSPQTWSPAGFGAEPRDSWWLLRGPCDASSPADFRVQRGPSLAFCCCVWY